jgi:hypothetical protein
VVVGWAEEGMEEALCLCFFLCFFEEGGGDGWFRLFDDMGLVEEKFWNFGDLQVGSQFDRRMAAVRRVRLGNDITSRPNDSERYEFHVGLEENPEG